MAKKKKKKRGIRSFSSGGSGVETSPLRPKHVPKKPPCGSNCPNHNMIRKALMTVSKAEDFEKTPEQAFTEAANIFLETTPFPAVCGRVCPHPCETDCNRIGYELDVGSQSEQARKAKQNASHERCDNQPVHSMLLNRCQDKNEEGAGRSADLETASAQQRDQKSADDRCI